MKNLDKFKGCMIGGAAGDALGYSLEFLDEEGIFRKYGKSGIEATEEYAKQLYAQKETRFGNR